MRKACFALLSCLLVTGCGKHETLPEQGAADVVTVSTLAGAPKLPLTMIRDKDRISALVAFVNSLPNRWSIPWYGPSVGQVYFEFISKGKSVGIFCVGQDFFGRNVDKAYSQSASRGQIEELGKLVDVDVWAYINSKDAGQSSEPTATPTPTATPKPTAAAHPTPAGAAPTRHP